MILANQNVQILEISVGKLINNAFSFMNFLSTDGWIGSNCHFDNDKLKTFEWNCNKYFQCAPGGLGLNLRDCQKGLYFDETKQRCDWLSTTSCHPEEPCIATTPSPPTVITTPSPDEVCSKKCNGGYPDPGSCTPDIDTRPYGICRLVFFVNLIIIDK